MSSIKRNKLLIGRAEECDVRPLSEEVSRRHCAVHAGVAEVWVEDLGSRNGTRVNGRRLTAPQALADGDVIDVDSVIKTDVPPSPAVAILTGTYAREEADEDWENWEAEDAD